MKFVRRFGAVTLLVAVVVGIGLAWNHFAASSLIGRLPGAGQNVNHLRPMDLGLTFMFQRVNWPVVERAVVIEALVIAAVVIADRTCRRVRQAWRARRTT